jgi:DNA helicase II / ATP-dependent DNA helicase PcrA
MKQLNISNKQEEILKSGGCRTLVHATAGSGKTTILILWIKKLLDSGIDPNKITAMTFTVNMAEELKSRIQGLKNVGTFHSICLQFLQDNLKSYKKVIVVNELEKKTIMNKIINSHYLKFRSKKELEYYIYKYYSFGITEDLLDFKVFIIKYMQFMQQNNLMDFDLLEYYTKKLLTENSSKSIRKKFQYLVIDEYQDTSSLEQEILDLMQPKNIFVVGDIMQNIYAFRGTTINNMLNFKSDDAHYMQLTYRCPGTICDFANHIIEMNDVDYKMVMEANSEGLPIDFIKTTGDDMKENLKKILEKYLMVYEPRDIFILCRTNSAVRNITDMMVEFPLVGIRSKYLSTKYLDLFVLFLKMGLTIYYDSSVELFIRAIQLEDPIVIEKWISSAKKNKKKLCTIVRERYPIFSQFESLLERDLGLQERAERLFSILAYGSMNQGDVDSAIEVVKYYAHNYNNNATDFVNWVMGGEMIIKSKINIEVMTVHQAKGLERKVVILPYIEDGVFPHPNAPFQEELRLFYVACTRAKEQLAILQTGNSSFIDTYKGD